MAHGEYVSFTNAKDHEGECNVSGMERAAVLLGESLEGRRRVLGEDHPLTKESLRASRHADEKLKELRAVNEKKNKNGNKTKEIAAASSISIANNKKKRRKRANGGKGDAQKRKGAKQT
mmetsp:Transcript_1497/g.2701  ORF Transcript_1497/g.2701 Transcript_1497/m.2701 type:complete len:119 (-) Transcript_1497:352-708(-)